MQRATLSQNPGIFSASLVKISFPGWGVAKTTARLRPIFWQLG